MIAGTEENNIYCFEINEIFDIDTKDHEFKYEKSEENIEKDSLIEHSSYQKMGSLSPSNMDYSLLEKNKSFNNDDFKENL